MRHVEQLLIVTVTLVVTASVGVAGFVHMRARTWDADFSGPGPSSMSPNLADAPRPPAPLALSEAESQMAGTRTEQPPREHRPAPAEVADSPSERFPRRNRKPELPRVDQPRSTATATPAPIRPDVAVESAEPAARVPTYVARIGAFRDEQHAAGMATRLAERGYHTSVSTQTSPEAARYVVVSELLRREVAEQRAKVLAAAGATPTIRARESSRGDGELAQLVYGLFSSLEEADVAARRIRRQGFTALAIVEGGMTYVVSVGPHQKARIDEVVASLSSALYIIEVEPAP